MRLNEFISVSQFCMNCIAEHNISFESVQEFTFDAKREFAKWTENISITLDEMLCNVVKTNRMFLNYATYPDTQGQFLHDLNAILSDYAYHTIHFNVLYSSLENVMEDDYFVEEEEFPRTSFNIKSDDICDVVTALADKCEKQQGIDLLKDIKNNSMVLHQAFLDLKTSQLSGSLDCIAKPMITIQYYSLRMHLSHLTLSRYLLS
jgi:hypothetical protein